MNCMLDIETTGTDPRHTAIIQLSAVKFDMDNRVIEQPFFDECLLIPNTRFWQEDTRDWWMSQPPHIIDGIWRRMRDPKEVLQEFATWIGPNAVLWAKPSHFEYPFLESYFKEFDVAMPFHYRMVNDLNSWCRARGLSDLSQEIPVQGDAHNAIFDVLHQIEVLFALLERTDVQTVG